MNAPTPDLLTRGVQRRLQALACLGWTWNALAARASVTAPLIGAWHRGENVTADAADVVDDLYRRLCMHVATSPDPDMQRAIAATRKLAAAAHWAPPLAWDDIDVDDAPAEPEPCDDVDVIAIEFAIAGRPVKLTTTERDLVIRELNARGFNDRPIARIVGVTERSVQRIRKRLGIPPAPMPRTHIISQQEAHRIPGTKGPFAA